MTDRVRPGCSFAPFHWNDLFGEYLSVNAVTSDAVDPISFQPEFKMCAVTLTKVATAVSIFPAPVVAAPAAEPVVVVPAANRSGAAAAFGLEDTPPPVLAEHERQYLVGFLAGLPSGMPGVPVLPAGAPFTTEHARWVNGVLAGMYSRAPQTADEPVGQAPSGRDVVVLWASQTGNAEEFAATAASRLAETGHRARLVGMDEADPRALPPAADLLLITSTFGDGDAPDNGSGFWEALTAADPRPWTADGTRCWPSATPRTTTSAGTAGAWTSASTSWGPYASPRAPTANPTTSPPPVHGWTRFWPASPHSRRPPRQQPLPSPLPLPPRPSAVPRPFAAPGPHRPRRG